MELLSTLANKLNIKDKAIIAITGSGGKTSLLTSLSYYYKKKGYKVLVSTTCKIFKDGDYKTDYVFTNLNQLINSDIKKGESVLYYSTTYNNKAGVENLSDFAILKDYFDIIIYEADGSKRLPLKIHNSTEPVVLDYTSHTICILSVLAMGKNTLEVVHRETENKIVDIAYLQSLLNREDGVYTNCKGSVITLLNACDTIKDIEVYNSLTSFYDIMKVSIKNNEVYL